MKGSRPIPCALLLAFAIATQFSIAPLTGGGADALDVPLLLVLWFALVDRISRVLTLVAALVALRVGLGVSSAAEVLLPILAAVLFVRIARGGVDPRDAGRRIALVIGALIAATATTRALWSVPYAGSIDGWATAILVGALAAALFFPLLDRLTPWVRSATHPM